jgi:macrodomain Ter protein organizer (MatP/YcbG family)
MSPEPLGQTLLRKHREAERQTRRIGESVPGDRADALAARSALRRLADAEKPLYQSLDEAQKRRFGIAIRFAARRDVAAAHPHGEGAPEHAR